MRHGRRKYLIGASWCVRVTSIYNPTWWRVSTSRDTPYPGVWISRIIHQTGIRARELAFGLVSTPVVEVGAVIEQNDQRDCWEEIATKLEIMHLLDREVRLSPGWVFGVGGSVKIESSMKWKIKSHQIIISETTNGLHVWDDERRSLFRWNSFTSVLHRFQNILHVRNEMMHWMIAWIKPTV